MIRVLLKWVLSSVLAVAIGSGAALAGIGTTIAPERVLRTSEAPTVLVAQASTPQTGAGSIVTLEPPRVSPYWFMATLVNGTVELTGHVPDSAMRDRFAAGGADISRLELGQGEPQRFSPAVDFGIGILARLSEGRFTVRENVITLKGRARSTDDYAAVESLLAQGAPQGNVLAMAEVLPPFADPYTWSALRGASGALEITGHVPSAAARTEIAVAAGAGTRDATAIADGAPDGFAEAAAAGLRVLALLDAGTVAYDGASWSLSGSVTTPLKAYEASTAFRTAGLGEAGWSYDVRLPTAVPAESLPVADPYSWSVEKLPAGTIALSGYVPNEGLQRYLVLQAGPRAVDSQDLASGAPDGFVAAARAGIAAVAALDEGKAAFSGDSWTLTGRTSNPELPAALVAELGQSVDSLTWRIDIKAPPPPPPVADPYLWSATKSADGSVSLTGYVPNEGLRSYVAVRAGTVAADTTEVAAGQPDGFVEDLQAALAALGYLVDGTAGYDGSAWSLVGTPRTAADAEAALAALSAGKTAVDAWVRTLADPLTAPAPAPEANGELPTPEPLAVPEIVAEPAEPAPAPEPETVAVETPAPVIEPPAEPETTSIAVVEPPAIAPDPGAALLPNARFDAVRADGGAIALSGVVPAEPARQYFGVIAGGVPVDGLVVAENLPDTFIPNAGAGVAALKTLASGNLSFDGQRWTLTGTADTAAQRDAALASISGLPDASDWSTDIALTPPIALCRREVVLFESSNQILFQSGRAQMTEESEESLAALARYLNDCPAITIEVEGHTDADGPEDMNLALSVSRAEAVVDGLVANGVAPERLYAIGYGESMPIATNDTAAGKRANRRIVFTLVE